MAPCGLDHSPQYERLGSCYAGDLTDEEWKVIMTLRGQLTILLLAIICSSCALRSFEVQKAPLKPDEAVVFDIDGTLTPNVSAIFTARDDAAKAARLFADHGYKIVYLSARIRIFQSGIPNWLKENHFPEGSIHVPQTAMDRSDGGAFKKRILEIYRENGWKFVAAYGDSSSDFEAYATVGIDKDRVFALQREGETSCHPGIWAKCFISWTEQIDGIMHMVKP
jgi:hypothetical protein